MKNFLLVALLSVGTYTTSLAQLCNITITPMDTTICPGDSVFISAVANLLNGGQAFDFNTGMPPAGWNTAGGNVYSQPCGPSPSGTPYYWASTVAAGQPPGISTAGFDVSCGGVLLFDMVFSVQSGPAPCEGPDLIGEGVELQYSIDGGATWIPIIYYNPNGTTQPSQSQASGGSIGAGQQTPFTTWATYSVPIPPGALTSNTMFQWTQYTNSGTAWDNWGLDNIVINATGPPCGSNAVVNWSTGLNDTLSFWMVPSADTAFIAFVYDTAGNYQCTSDSVFVWLSDGNFGYSLVDELTVYCPDDSSLASVLNVTNALEPMTYSWSNSDTTSASYLNSNGASPDTLLYYVTITDACGFADLDSVSLIVNQTLTIDSLVPSPQINCSPNGSAQSYISGNSGQTSYSWTGPGNSGTYNSSQTSINGITSGWYYFTVTDAVCSATDSIFVDNVILDNMIYTVPDTLTVYCPNDSILAEMLNVQNATLPLTYSWSNGSTTNSSYLVAGDLEQDELTFTVTITDACGYTRTEEVILVVNKLLNIDSLSMIPTTTCQPDGSVQGYVSGATGQPLFVWENLENWEQPGSGSSIDANSWNNIASNWYYFTVTDDVCSDVDSIFLEMLDPPIAIASAVPSYGCAPLTVTILNDSENTTYFAWDFGDGSTGVTTDLNNQTHTYYESSTITLTAYLDATQDCGNTTTINITIPTCGCTNPIADNYNPDAVVDDGSCTFPLPIVNPPNVFTPNGDGLNDYLVFSTINTIKLEMVITNRWGNVLYEQTIDPSAYDPSLSTGLGFGWDGRTKNDYDAEEGTYFYKYVATGVNGDLTDGHGFIHLVRE